VLEFRCVITTICTLQIAHPVACGDRFPLHYFSMIRGICMPRYYFRISSGTYAGAPGEGFDLPDNNAAWVEMTRVGADLIGGVTRKLKQNSEWLIELLDESRTPLFGIRVTAETRDQVAETSDVREPSSR
jgi:hypothetical protein